MPNKEEPKADIRVDVLARPPLVAVSGAVDAALGKELRTTFVGLLQIGHGEIDLDLSRVEALEVDLEALFAEVWTRGLVVNVRNPSPVARQLLHLEAS